MTRLSQLPPDATSQARRIADLERAVRELRAAKRAAHTEVRNGKLIMTSETGWQVILDPGDEFPVIYFRSPAGAEMAALNATGDPSRAGYNLSSGPFGDDTANDWRWVNFAGRLADGGNAYLVTRTRDSDTSAGLGGWLYLDPAITQLGVQDLAAGMNQILQIGAGAALFDQVRGYIRAPASSSPALTLATQTGHTGTLLTLIHNLVAVLTVATSGDVALSGQLTAQTLAAGAGTSSIGGDLTVTGAIKKTGETWHTPTFGTNWATGGTLGGNSTFRGLQYRKTVDDEVRLVGAAVSTGTATTITTLPAGYRPPPNKRCLVPAYFSTGSGTPTAGWVQVTEAGVVGVGTSLAGFTVASGTQCYLDGTFPLGNLP